MEHTVSGLTIQYYNVQNTLVFLSDVIIYCGSAHLNKQSCSARVALGGAGGFLQCEWRGGFTLHVNRRAVVALVKSSVMKSYSRRV